MARRTKRIWKFILRTCEQQNGVPPTIQQIVDQCGLSSKSVANYHLRKLIADGKIIKVSRTRWYVAGAEWKAPA